MSIAFVKIRLSVRRVLSACIGVAFLIASMGIGHGASASAHSVPTDEIGAYSSQAPGQSSLSQIVNCAESSEQHDRDQPSDSDGIGDCCLLACTPTFTVNTAIIFAEMVAHPVELASFSDQVADSNAPEGLFRPPRTFI